MWDSDESLHPRHMPTDERLIRLIGDRNTALMRAHELERNSKLASSAYDIERMTETAAGAKKARDEVASYDQKLQELNYDPEAYPEVD
jgi:hypothetical protein